MIELCAHNSYHKDRKRRSISRIEHILSLRLENYQVIGPLVPAEKRGICICIEYNYPLRGVLSTPEPPNIRGLNFLPSNVRG